MFACIYAPSSPQEKLLGLASSFSPLVEDTAPGLVVFSIAGLGRLIGTPREIAAVVARKGAEAGIQANLAISADPDTAVLAASNLAGITLIPPGVEAAHLSGLPVEALRLWSEGAPEILATLHRWGIKTLGEMAELPELGFVARFCEEGARLLRWARGETRRALRAVKAPEHYARHVDLEHPQFLLEPLSFVLSSMLGELMEALVRHGLAANRVTLALKLVNRARHERTLEFPVPVRDPKVILKQLQFDLEAHPPRAAILGVGVQLRPAEPRALQHGFFVPQAPAPVKLQLTLARLTALAGENNVGSPVLFDTHRRDAFAMRSFSPETAGASGYPRTAQHTVRFAFHYYRPALAAQVRVKEGRPAMVNTQAVVAAAGPWRASGEWWTATPWERDEWDVELANGGVYRVCRASRGWFVEGMYD